MAHASQEVEEMVGAADSLVLNLGTPTNERVEAMSRAGRAAGEKGIPIVLDPAGVGATHETAFCPRRRCAVSAC